MAVSDTELERARQVAAEIVASRGDAFWPVFERVNDVWNRRLDRARRIAACLASPANRRHPAGPVRRAERSEGRAGLTARASAIQGGEDIRSLRVRDLEEFAASAGLVVRRQQPAHHVLDIVLADELGKWLVAETGRQGSGARLAIADLRGAAFAGPFQHRHCGPEGLVGGGQVVAPAPDNPGGVGVERDPDRAARVEGGKPLWTAPEIVPAPAPQAQESVPKSAGSHGLL